MLLVLLSDSNCGSLRLRWQIFQCLEAAAVTVEGNLLPCSALKMSGAKAIAAAELIKEIKLVKRQMSLFHQPKQNCKSCRSGLY